MVRKWVLGGVLVALVVATVGCRVPVSPNKANGWFFLNEGSTGTGHYTNGPATPPNGRGSALLTVDATGREAIATALYKGTALSTIKNMTYSTYQSFSGSAQETPTLEFDTDYDSTDGNNTYQGRLVFVPGATGSVLPNQWQTWDTINGTPGGAWYSSASDGSANRPIVGNAVQADPPCTQAHYCTWAQIQTNYPDAQIRSGSGLLMARIGGPITGGWSGAVDNITLGGVMGNNVSYDFEPGDGTITVNTAKAASLDFGFSQETASGTGAFVSGPTGADGTGSAHITTDATGGEALSTGVFAGVALPRFTTLSYKTYVQAGANAPTLQLDADYDSSDASTNFQGRIVFEPSESAGAAVTPLTWQTWDPLTAASGWWQTGNPIVGGVPTGTKACTQGAPCSLTALLAAYPNLSVRPVVGQVSGQANDGRLWLKAGGNWGGFDGNVDTLTVGLDSTATPAIFDFEP